MTQTDPSLEAEIPLEAAPEPSETEPNLAPASEVLTAPPGAVAAKAPEAPSVEPGEPPAGEAPLGSEVPTEPYAPKPEEARNPVPEEASQWSSLARAALLAALIGMSLVVWVKVAFGDSWLTPFLQGNELPMPDRMLFLRLMLVGAAVALLAAGGVGYRLLSRGRDATVVENTLWFLSPLILLPAGPALFRYSAWKDQHQELLPVVLFGGMLCELFFFQALRRTPPRLVAWLEELRRDVPAIVQKHWALGAILVCCTAYSVFMSFYTIRWHHKLGTAVFDLAITNNLIYGGLEGVFNHSPIIFPEDPGKYVANHVQTGLYAFLPIYALYPQSETLQVIQSTSLGFGALPLFLFARKRIPEWAALVIAVCYLAYYPLHGANFYEVKTVPIAAAFLLTTIWAADAQRWVVCWLSFTLTLLLREDMPVGLAVVGGFFLLSGHRPRAGLVMAAVATAWFVFIRFYVMDKAGQWWFPSMYKDLWAPGEQGFKSVIKTLITNPVFTLKHIIVEKKVYYLLHLLVPLMFLPARRWYLWAAFVPGAILTLLVTDYAPPTMFSFQYVMHWAPYIFVAAVLCVASIAERADFGKARAQAAVLAMAFASAVLSFNYGAFAARDKGLASGYAKVTFSFTEKERQRYADLKEIIRDIPPKATVAATEHVGPHVSSRVGFYSLRRGSHGAEYLLARQQELGLDRTKQSIYLALKDNEYGVIKRIGELALMKKGADPSKNQELIDDWSLASASKRKKASRKTTAPAEPGPNGETAAEPATTRPEEPAQPQTEGPEGGTP